MSNQTELRAAETILEMGAKMNIKAPIFLRWFGKKTIAFRLGLPTAGTLMRITRVYLQMNISDEKLDNLSMDDVFKLQGDHLLKPALVVAHGFLNSKLLSKLFSKRLAKFILEYLPQKDISAIAELLILSGGTKDFINFIRLTRDLVMTTPNLSQTPNGS